jgi:hypothetical protein
VPITTADPAISGWLVAMSRIALPGPALMGGATICS